MDTRSVVSDNVGRVGYDAATQTLRIEFRNGGTYDYLDVSETLYREMLQPRPWRRVGEAIKAHNFIRR